MKSRSKTSASAFSGFDFNTVVKKSSASFNCCCVSASINGPIGRALGEAVYAFCSAAIL